MTNIFVDLCILWSCKWLKYNYIINIIEYFHIKKIATLFQFRQFRHCSDFTQFDRAIYATLFRHTLSLYVLCTNIYYFLKLANWLFYLLVFLKRFCSTSKSLVCISIDMNVFPVGLSTWSKLAAKSDKVEVSIFYFTRNLRKLQK